MPDMQDTREVAYLEGGRDYSPRSLHSDVFFLFGSLELHPLLY
jgi:hypothetical protein